MYGKILTVPAHMILIRAASDFFSPFKSAIIMPELSQGLFGNLSNNFDEYSIGVLSATSSFCKHYKERPPYPTYT